MKVGDPLGDCSYEELDALYVDPAVSLCWGHGIVEDRSGKPYIVCFECGHVYRTAQELVDLYEEEKPEGCPTPPADKIGFCQVCVHDF